MANFIHCTVFVSSFFPVSGYVSVLFQSLVKSSWESRDQPTIIPQGVPYMVKLLRYYVSEDAVYLHLEHVKGEQFPVCVLVWSV